MTAEAESIAADLAGEYGWVDVMSGELLDFETLTLLPSGLYVARVVATLVNPGVRSFGSIPCMLPEEGEWNAYLVGGQCRLRIRPTTGRARVYSVARTDGHMAISRRGQKTVLFAVPPSSGTVPIITIDGPSGCRPAFGGTSGDGPEPLPAPVFDDSELRSA